MALLNQTTTVQKVLDQCSLHTKLQNFFGVAGISNEPGLTIANNTQQTLLAKDMAWKFNRKELSSTAGNFLVTQFGVQDYRFAGASAFLLLNNGANLPTGGMCIDLAAGPVNGGTAGISVSGGVATVQTIDPHFLTSSHVGQTIYMSGNTNSAFNSTWTFNSAQQTSAWSNGWTITSVPDQSHFTFAATSAQIAAGSSGAPGITDLGWLESASVTDINSTAFPLPIKPIEAVRRLAPTYTATGDRLAVCSLIDYGNGVIKFRLSEPMGTYSFQINAVYQARAPKLTTPQSVFAWPDDLSYVLIEVALWQAFRFATGISGQEAQTQMGVAQSAILQALAAEDKEDSIEAITPQWSLMR